MQPCPKKIGLLLHDFDSPYSGELISGILETCKANNISLWIFPAGEMNRPHEPFEYQRRSVAAFVNKRNLDALIIASATQSNFISYEELCSYVNSFKPLPIVSIGVKIPNIPSIVIDCKPALQAVVRHLAEVHSCKKIAVFGVNTASIEADERTGAIVEELERLGLYDKSKILRSNFSYNGAKGALQTYINEHGVDFDALVSLNDEMAFAFLDYCSQNGVAVPEQVKVTAFDDLPQSSVVRPTLTSVNQNLPEQGKHAVEAIIKMLGGEEVPPVQSVRAKALFRQSCGCLSAEDGCNAIDESGARLMPTKLAEIKTALNWLKQRTELFEIIRFQTETMQNITMHTLKHRLNQDFTDFGIESAALCLYEKPIETEAFLYFPLPQKAQLFAGYDPLTNYATKMSGADVFFNPQEGVLPNDFAASTETPTIVSSVFVRDIQYGYLVFRPGEFDPTMYDVFCRTLSNLIGFAYTYTKENERKTQLEETNMRLLKFSRTDELTQLLNRRGFITAGQKAINVAMDIQQNGMVIYGDMDGLKRINDTYGHEVGDRAIKAEAKILRDTFRSSDIVGRLGGDEFAIVAIGLDYSTFLNIKKHLARDCEKWNQSSGEEFTLSISLGCAAFSDGDYNLFELLKLADSSQYEEKRQKKAERKD